MYKFYTPGALSIEPKFLVSKVILEIFYVKRKGFLHVGEKLAISLVDHDGARSWCKREQIREQ